MSSGTTNFHNIQDSKFSQLTDTFISLYNDILEYPQDKMRKGIVKPLPRIGYMVYEKYLKENYTLIKDSIIEEDFLKLELKC